MRIGVAEARRRFSELLDRAIRGEIVEVARRGEVVAVIGPPHGTTPPEPIQTVLRTWRRNGASTPGRTTTRSPTSATARTAVRPVVRYLLDTNVLSELARPRPDDKVLARLEEVADDAAIAAVAWHELRFGVARLPAGRRREALAAFVSGLAGRFPVLPTTSLQRSGTPASGHGWTCRQAGALRRRPDRGSGGDQRPAARHPQCRGLRGVRRSRVESWWAAD